jgi:hypothetical protein
VTDPIQTLREATACPHYENVDALLHSGCSWCAHMEEIGRDAALTQVENLVRAAQFAAPCVDRNATLATQTLADALAPFKDTP